MTLLVPILRHVTWGGVFQSGYFCRCNFIPPGLFGEVRWEQAALANWPVLNLEQSWQGRVETRLAVVGGYRTLESLNNDPIQGK